MSSAYKLNKQGDNIQPWHTPFPIWNQSVVPCPVLTVASWPAHRFLKRQVRWSGIPISFRIFHSLLWSTQSKANPHYILHNLSSPHLHHLLPRLMLQSTHCFSLLQPCHTHQSRRLSLLKRKSDHAPPSQIMPLHHRNLQWLSTLSKSWSQNSGRKTYSQIFTWPSLWHLFHSHQFAQATWAPLLFSGQRQGMHCLLALSLRILSHTSA